MCYVTDMAEDAGLSCDIGPIVNEDRERYYTFTDPAGHVVGRVLGRPAAVELIVKYRDGGLGVDR